MATTIIKNFSDLKFETHHADKNGVQSKMFFDNGYGVSVIQFYGSYGFTRGLYELAVLHGNEEEWELCYTTEVTHDVEGHLTHDEVSELMLKVQSL